MVTVNRAAKSFSDLCIYAYECWQMYKTMYMYKDKIKSNIWDKLGGILHEYSFLQVAKINDREKHAKDYNLSLAYLIARVKDASYTNSYNKFRDDNSEFIEATNSARNKVIVHYDLGVSTSGAVEGAFTAGLDDKYFDSLHEIISEGYDILGLGPFPDWPPFIEADTKTFMDKLEKAFSA